MNQRVNNLANPKPKATDLETLGEFPAHIAYAISSAGQKKIGPLVQAVVTEYYRQKEKELERNNFLYSLPPEVFTILHSSILGLHRASQFRKPITNKKPTLQLLELFVRANSLDDAEVRKEATQAMVSLFISYTNAVTLSVSAEMELWLSFTQVGERFGPKQRNMATRHLNWLARQIKASRKRRSITEHAGRA